MITVFAIKKGKKYLKGFEANEDRPLLSCYPCVEKYIQEMAERIINKEKEDE